MGLPTLVIDSRTQRAETVRANSELQPRVRLTGGAEESRRLWHMVDPTCRESSGIRIRVFPSFDLIHLEETQRIGMYWINRVVGDEVHQCFDSRSIILLYESVFEAFIFSPILSGVIELDFVFEFSIP